MRFVVLLQQTLAVLKQEVKQRGVRQSSDHLLAAYAACHAWLVECGFAIWNMVGALAVVREVQRALQLCHNNL